ncbi:MAG: PDZ domain-containing protein [Bacilli bacterium]|nr:PDZ domain-containing protein [Bacilli bacterium]
MKKILLTLSIIILLPLNMLAYSENIIPGGENIGIEINSEGLIVVGFYKVNGKYIGSETLEVGDIILTIEGVNVDSINEMSAAIEKNIKNNEVNIQIKRNGKIKNAKLTLIKDEGVYKTGLYIKEKVTGIGTITYIDPKTKIYGALGHEIIMNETKSRVEVKSGNIYESYVNGIDRSVDGAVGSKNATILYEKQLGTINENKSVGIFGKYNKTLPEKETLKVAEWKDIKTGAAKIYTITEKDVVEEYEIEITKLNKNEINSNKSISFKITDERLLERSGGIVQGMSGSPIIQDDKIIGAVTHVIIDDVNNGYGVFIRTMLEEGEN